MTGPGGAEASVDPLGGIEVVFHVWSSGAVGYDTGGVRQLRSERFDVVDGSLQPARV